jgi:AcrR family transcriptional regulator
VNPTGGDTPVPPSPASQETEEGATPSESGAASGAQKRKKLRKEEIVAEATRLFAERGYEGTSMGDLAERVGLRKASLFHHFESKDVLYATVLSQLLEGVQTAIVGAARSEGSFVERVDALTDAITGMLGQEPHAARLLIREAMDWGPVMRDKLANSIQEVLRAAVEFAKAGQKEGVFNPQLDAHHLIVTLIGIYFMPFVIDRTVEEFAGMSPFQAPFVETRRREVREQIRRLVLVPN